MPTLRPPQVAIIGRPNVGKSSLLNRLAGRRVSIVDPTPGVTRDRVMATIDLDPPTDTPRGTPARRMEVIDTGGYGMYMAAGGRFDDVGADLSTLTPEIERQIKAAIAQADIILFVSDAQAGMTGLDETIAALIRHSGDAEKVIPIANKVDDESWLGHAVEMAALGFGEPLGVSAENGFNTRALRETLYERLGEDADVEVSGVRSQVSGKGKKASGSQVSGRGEPTDSKIPDTYHLTPDTADLKLAIVGKRNSGKSTLINAWAGEERVIVSEIAGTTRDSIDVRIEIDGKSLIAIDTAGVRKRKSFADDIEFYAHTRMEAAIKRADVVVLLLDATAEVSQVDQKLAKELQEQFKPTVIVVNKWDVVQERGDRLKPEDYHEYLTQQLRGLDYAPIIFISAKTGEGLKDVLAMAFNLHEQATHRESTAKLNAAIGEVMKKRGPSSKQGARAKVYYVSQVATAPPTIVLVVNDPELFHGQYERYLLNELREVLPFSEVPIRLLFRKRERVPLEEMKQRGARREREREEHEMEG